MAVTGNSYLYHMRKVVNARLNLSISHSLRYFLQDLVENIEPGVAQVKNFVVVGL